MRLAVAFLCVGIALAWTAGCDGAADGPVVGDAKRGEALYNQETLGANEADGCTFCHKYDDTVGDATKAPFTKGTATRAATRVPGMTAEEYIRESIESPDVYLVENYRTGNMYGEWTVELSEQEVADLVAYLLTEK